MKDFHRSFICRSTETGKKNHKSKHHSNKNEMCKCYAPFLKLHYYDCPAARKPCPIHGTPHRPSAKDEKTEKKESMIISFHPSSKTDKLFRPVKNLLAHCNPDTRINLEYYSSNNSVPKGGMKNSLVQTSPEEFKKSLGSSVFVEKTKSFVTDKTNRMKRLKQCFHSPCNSIVARTGSEITLKNKLNENFSQIPKRDAIETNIPEEPRDIYLYEKFKWTSSNKMDSSDWEKSSDDKIKSDFLTVTKQGEDKVVDHKIFEIKHKKGFGNIHLTKLPGQSPFVYSAYDFQKPKHDLSIQTDPPSSQKNLERYKKDNELMKQIVIKEDRSASQSSSNGSVYFTPFILVPPYGESYTSDESKYGDDAPKQMPENLDGKAGDNTANVTNTSVQTEDPFLEKRPYEESTTSDDSTSTKISEIIEEPIALTQEKGVGSEIITPIYAFEPEEAPKKVAEEPTSSSVLGVSQNTSEPLNKSAQASPSENGEKDGPFSSYDEKPKSKAVGTVASRSIYVQTDGVQKKEVSVVYDGTKNVSDKITQTVPVFTRNVQVETMAAKKNKSQMTYWTMTKSVQTSFTLSDSRSQSQEGECMDSEPNVTFAATSYTRRDSNREANKSPWKSPYSDGNIYEQSGDPESENLIGIHHHVCLCENSETSNSDSEYNSYEKISKLENSSYKKNDVKPIVEKENERTLSGSKKDMISKGEQTSLSDLSELARMVDQFFDKMSREAFKSCECEKIKKKESIISQRILLADSSKPAKKTKPLMVDAEVQTTFRVIIDPAEGKTKESSTADQNDETTFVCKMCRTKVSTVLAEISTTTDSLEKTQPTTTNKEIMVVSVGTSTGNLLVAKKSVGVCVSYHNLVECFLKSEELQISECLSTGDLPEAQAQPPMNETRSLVLPGRDNKTGKGWASYAAALGQSDPKVGPENYPQSAPVKEQPGTSSQTNERKTVEKPRTFDDWKTPNYSSLRETYQSQRISKVADPPKQKVAPARGKSGIPTASNTLRKNFRDREPEENKTCTQVIFTHCANKQTFASKNDRSSTPIIFNRNALCICDRVNNPPQPNTEPSTSNNVSRGFDQKPPLPKKPQPGGSKGNKNGGPSQTSPKKPSDSKKTMIFPAIISPIWYQDFRKTLQMIKSCHESCLHDSKRNVLKPKRFWEEEDDSPGGKKVKGKCDGSGENCGFEQSNFVSNERRTVDERESTGFVWVPSSSLQFPKAEAHPKTVKSTRSESKVLRTCLQNSTLFKGFNKRTANVLSAKSCRLKPVQVNEKHPFRKLFECRLCKSLNFLKPDEKGTLRNERTSEGTFGYDSSKAKDESLIPDDENCEPANWAFSSRLEDRFLVEYSFSPGSSNSTDLSENSDYADDEHEAIKSSSSSPPGARAVPFSNVTYGSKSCDTFWFGSDSRKNKKN